MKTIKCDRCGENISYIPPYVNVARDGYVQPTINVTIWNSIDKIINEVDLCRKCQKKVYDFIFDYGNDVGA